MSSAIDFQGIAAVDKQIATLLECKPLPESEVRALAEKVTRGIKFNISIGEGNSYQRIKRFSSASPSNYLWRYPRLVPRS